MYPEYFGGTVLLAALGKLEFFFTDSDMLTHIKSDCRTSYGSVWNASYSILRVYPNPSPSMAIVR